MVNYSCPESNSLIDLFFYRRPSNSFVQKRRRETFLSLHGDVLRHRVFISFADRNRDRFRNLQWLLG